MKTRITLHTSLGNFERTFTKTAEIPFPLMPGMHVGPLVWIQFEVTHVGYLMEDGLLEVQAKQTAPFQDDVDHISGKLQEFGWKELFD